MGQSLTVATAYGFVLPEWNYEDELPEEFEDDEDGYYESLVKEFPLLDLTSSYFTDYHGGYAVIVKSTHKYYWDAVIRPLDNVQNPSPDELQQLNDCAVRFKLTPEYFGPLVIPSVG